MSTPANIDVKGSEAQLERERLLTRSELMQTAVGSVVVTADHSLAQAARDADRYRWKR